MASLYDALLLEGLERFGGDAVPYLCEDIPFSFATLVSRCEQRAVELDSLGIQKGDAVVLALPDCIELITLFFSLIKLGAKPLCISELNRKASMLEYARSAAAAALFVDGGNAELLAEMEGEDPGLTLFAVHTDLCLNQPPSCIRRTEEPFGRTVEDGAVAYLTATSGSNGKPKIIPNGHEQVLRAMRHLPVDTLHLTERDVLLCASKISYTYGLSNNLLTPVVTGAAALLYRRRTNLQLLYEQSQKHAPTAFFAVPSIFQSILADGTGAHALNTARMRMFFSSGDALPKAVAEEWRARFGRGIIDAVGCSEACISYLINWNETKGKEGSAGRPLDFFELKLVGEDGAREVSTGVLWVRGDCTANAYLYNPEASARKFRDGWIVTNDVLSVDRDGYYWFEGRVDHLLKINGLWVSSMEIRDALSQHELVSEAEVLKISLTERDRIVAFVTLQTPCQDAEGVLRQYLHQRLSKYKYPWHICTLQEMPRTLNGKTDKNALCAWFRAQLQAGVY